MLLLLLFYFYFICGGGGLHLLKRNNAARVANLNQISYTGVVPDPCLPAVV